jgi:CHASE2 domain-containing sensor protein
VRDAGVSKFALKERFLGPDPVFGRVCTLVGASLLTGLIYFVFYPNFIILEERLGASGWTLGPVDEVEERITIVAIDEKSLSEVGPWPWPRETIAKLVTALDSAGVQLQLHDIVYSESRDGDDELASAFRASNGVVISQIPILSENSSDPNSLQQFRSGVMTNPLAGVSCNSPLLNFPKTDNFIAANAQFSDISKGHITPLVNGDGMITKLPAVICVEGLPYPSFALSALIKASGLGNKAENLRVQIRPGLGLFSAAARLTLDSYPGLAIPLDFDGNLRISYAYSPESYRAISAADVLGGSADLEALENAWVLVGATAFGLDDVVPTPYSGATPGVELQARILGSILDVEVPYSPRTASWISFSFCLLYSALVLRAALSGGSIASRGVLFLILALPVASWAAHAAALNSAAMWLGWIYPALHGLVSGGAIFVFEQARLRRQRNRVLANLTSYLPVNVAQEIAYSLPSSNVAATRREVTLLCADLRNFSAYCEARSAEESAAVLHFFFQHATKVIEGCHGRIHEFKGDGLIAIWDTPGTESAERAFRAGSLMVQQINRQLLEAFAPRGLEPLAVGVGIEQGPALIGSIGPAHRRAQALLGDTVTVALRIQELTADLAQPLLLGECVARQLGNTFIESQGSYLLVGLKNPHTLFAPVPEKVEPRGDAKKPKLFVLSGGKG